MLDALKERVLRANLDLVKHGLVIHTWGNASGRDKDTGLVVIKPSGVSYDEMKVSDMVIIDETCKVIEGNLKPSTDAPTHLLLYKTFPGIGGVVHTHSTYATSWAQANKAIPPFGTTHADHFHGEVPCSRELTREEIQGDYELNTGKVIVEIIGDRDPLHVPSALVSSHGPFSWGRDVENAVYNAVALEEIARMAFYTVLLGKTDVVDSNLLEKHFSRKHGRNSYYGQK
ncbi:MAG: L-ribulose-5-phosphate 4-epimerase [Bacteroidales bacterium]